EREFARQTRELAAAVARDGATAADEMRFLQAIRTSLELRGRPEAAKIPKPKKAKSSGSLSMPLRDLDNVVLQVTGQRSRRGLRAFAQQVRAVGDDVDSLAERALAQIGGVAETMRKWRMTKTPTFYRAEKSLQEWWANSLLYSLWV